MGNDNQNGNDVPKWEGETPPVPKGDCFDAIENELKYPFSQQGILEYLNNSGIREDFYNKMTPEDQNELLKFTLKALCAEDTHQGDKDTADLYDFEQKMIKKYS